MYKQSATNLSSLSKKEIKNWLQSFDAVLTDCDGVLWNYNELIDGTDTVINAFKNQGKNIFFATNNSSKTREEFAEKAIRFGFDISKENIISTAYVAAKYLANLKFTKKVYVVGSNGIGQELDAYGIEHCGIGPDNLKTNYSDDTQTIIKTIDKNVGAVIVGFDEHISYPKLTKAATYLNKPECIFIATNTDERLPMPNAVIPGAGSMVRAIETCSERQALIMGKPNVNFCCDIINEYGLTPQRTLMIGDRCNTDILLGTNCGFQTLLVGTGIHTMCDVEKYRLSSNKDDKKLIPDLYISKLSDLQPYL